MRSVRISIVLGTALLAGRSPGQDLNGNFTADSAERRSGAADCNHSGFLDPVDAGRPAFSLGVEHLNGTWPYLNNTNDAQVLDFDQDGDPDLAALSSGPNGQGFIALWRNDGGPGLTWVADITAAGWSILWSIRTGDLNGDGRADMVVGDGGYANVYVLLATGPGTFGPPRTLAASASNNGIMRIALGDLDGDGDLDIAAPNAGVDLVEVWRNNGAGVFSGRQSFATGDTPTSVAIGDFTGDGLADLAVANRLLFAPPGVVDGTVTLLRNTGAGFAAHATLTMPTNTGPFGVMHPEPWDLALVDHDHDGDMDLIVSSNESQRLDLFVNAGAGSFSLRGSIGRSYYLESAAARLVVADLDGDGWEDVAWGDTASHAATVFLNQRDGSFRSRVSVAMGNRSGTSLAAADFDGDGRMDLVSANDASRTFNIARGVGGGLFDAPVRLRPAEYPGNTMFGDFNGDGVPDAAYMLQSQTGILGIGVFAGAGDGTFAATPLMSPLSSAGYFIARDVNRDGVLDLVETVGRCNIHLGRGDGTFLAPIVNPVSVLRRNVVVDINRDGLLDIVWISPGHPGSLIRSLGDGAGRFGAATVVGEAPAEDESIAFGDLNGDGAPEIFTGHRQGLAQPGGILSIYPNTGSGGFGPRQDRFIVAQPLSPAVGAIACADFDGDGDNDVMASALGLRLYRNAGGVLPELGEVVCTTSASVLRAEDIDLDGDPDLYGQGTSAIAFMNDGPRFTPMFLPVYDSNARDIVVADADGDGRSDVLLIPENSWSSYLFLNRPARSRDVNGNGVPDECEAPACTADFNGDGFVDLFDYGDFVGCFETGVCPPGLGADVNGDGFVDFFDYGDFVAAFEAGC